jgi:hypothetical protein
MVCAFDILTTLEDKGNSQNANTNLISSRSHTTTSVRYLIFASSFFHFNRRDAISIRNPFEDTSLDAFDTAFLDKLSQLKIPKDEEEKLFAMKNFIKSASRALHR